MLSKIRIAAFTDRGTVRPNNEDAVSVGNELLDETHQNLVTELDDAFPLIMVADGMGGHSHGSIASRSAIKCILRTIRPPFNLLSIEQAVSAANHCLYDMMAKHTDLAGMGTTIVGAVFINDSIIHFNVGDSRAYRHRKGELARLSQDDVPGIPGQSRRSSHAITQSLGGRTRRAAITTHVGYSALLESGEKLLLCSDGLTDMVGDDAICKALDARAEANVCAKVLLDLAMNAGGRDNISIVVAQAI